MPKPPRSVLEYAIAKGGVRKGMRCATFVAQWTVAQSALGREPSLEEAAAWWKENERTWYRRLGEFREIFDRLDSPAPIAAAVIEQAQPQDVPQAITGLAALAPIGVLA